MIEHIALSDKAREVLDGPVGSEIQRELLNLVQRAQSFTGSVDWATLEEFKYAHGVTAGIQRVAAALAPQ